MGELPSSPDVEPESPPELVEVSGFPASTAGVPFVWPPHEAATGAATRNHVPTAGHQYQGAPGVAA